MRQQRQRIRFLQEMLSARGGNPRAAISVDPIFERLGIEHGDSHALRERLADEGLVEFYCTNPLKYRLTAAGIEASEASLVEGREINRLFFLHALHEKVGDDAHAFVSMWALGEELGLQRDEITSVTDYLEASDLVEHVSIGGAIGLTHAGLAYVEDLLAGRTRGRGILSPQTVNILNIERGESIQISQSGAESTSTQNQ